MKSARDLEQLLAQGKQQGLFDSAALDIRILDEKLYSTAVGKACFFDLASLTKPLAIGTLAARAISENQFTPQTRISTWFSEFLSGDKASVTISDILRHQSGLPAFSDWYMSARTAEEVIAAVAAEPLQYPPGTQTIYSDAGFILLAAILARSTSVATLFADLCRTLQLKDIQYGPISPSDQYPVATTGYSAFRKRHLCGEVHDENAHVLGDLAGHAGLFGTAAAVSQLALLWLQADKLAETGIFPAVASDFISVPETGRPFAWDRVDIGISQAGTMASPHAYGHLGFTGTSVWVDPEKKVAVTLLTNRVACDGTGVAFRAWRPKIYDLIWKSLDTRGLTAS